MDVLTFVSWLGVTAAGGVLAAIYFAPALVAAKRGHRHYWPIFVGNLSLGWTVIGWSLALAWALLIEPKLEPPRAATPSRPPSPEEKNASGETAQI